MREKGRAPGRSGGPEPTPRIFDRLTLANQCDTFHDPAAIEAERAAIARAALSKALLMEVLNLNGSSHDAIWSDARVTRLERRRRAGGLS